MTFSRFDNTFCVICIDDSKSMPILKFVEVLRHASFIKPLGFNFSDASVCFLKNDEFFNQLKLVHSHILNSEKADGTNMMLAFSYQGKFLNIYNKALINNVVINQHYFTDIDNFFVQIISSLILLIYNVLISLIDMFLLCIEKKNFSIF